MELGLGAVLACTDAGCRVRSLESALRLEATYYALFHVPRDQQPQRLRDIACWLKPGGWLVATMGTQSSIGDVEDDWLGAPMYWSSYDAESNVRLVEEAGLEIVESQEETEEEHGQPISFLWIVAKKP